ncbi:MAG: DNA gyrase subunit A [Patescibacteria group bacterium]
MSKEEITALDASNNKQEATNLIKADITTEMQKAYLDYSMSVIVSRALPDVRDGLKPVHRRIIYAMQDQTMYYNGKYHKCAAVVGEVLKKYHPHSDTSVYDALVRMAQNFSLRYTLIDGQGNFGSIDGDPPAAMRYTECKMEQLAGELYRDIDKDTVDFMLNDLQNEEPAVLPSVIPNVLLNGAQGIAVGMATNIPPHNLNELIDGINLLIENSDYIGEKPEKDTKHESEEIIAKTGFSSSATVEDLVKVVKGPDFPTGGIIYDQKEIIQMYATGKGRIVTRAKMEIEEDKKGRMRIIVTEIPYQVNKSSLIEKIAKLVRDKKITGVADLRDESNRKGMRIVIELKKDALPKKVQNRLYKHTPLQTSFNANMVALLDGEPKLMTLKVILEEFIKHRQIVVVRRTIFLLKKARARQHILLGLKIALDNLDEVIKLIRNSKDTEVAKTGLMTKFKLTEIQAQAILDMQLRRLAALERQKIEDELKQITETIEDYEDLLISPERIMTVVKDELTEIREKYGDERKTKVIKSKVGELSDEDLIVNESCIITISRSGYIKRLKPDTYKKQGRGGKGVKGQELREEDIVDTIRICNTHDYALFFTNKGKVYKLRIWEIPETLRTAKGTALVNFLGISQSENIQAFISLSAEQMDAEEGFIVFGTEKGTVKKTSLADFANIRSSGIMAIKIADGDDLVRVLLSDGKSDVLMVTAQGQSIRFPEKQIRTMGRTAGGVMGIKLVKDDDQVVGMDLIDENSTKTCSLFVVTEKGNGKKTLVTEYKAQNRGGSGILTYKVTPKTGKVNTGRIIDSSVEMDILIVSSSGKVIRLDEKQIPQLGRATQGVRLISLSASDKVSSTAIISEEEELEKIENE